MSLDDYTIIAEGPVTARISLADLRELIRMDAHPGQLNLVLAANDVLALVEAVEAAQRVVGVPFGQIDQRDYYRLRETLAPFVFGDTPKPIRRVL